MIYADIVELLGGHKDASRDALMMLLKCAKCGECLNGNELYCPHCGRALTVLPWRVEKEKVLELLNAERVKGTEPLGDRDDGALRKGGAESAVLETPQKKGEEKPTSRGEGIYAQLGRLFEALGKTERQVGEAVESLSEAKRRMMLGYCYNTPCHDCLLRRKEGSYMTFDDCRREALRVAYEKALAYNVSMPWWFKEMGRSLWSGKGGCR